MFGFKKKTYPELDKNLFMEILCKQASNSQPFSGFNSQPRSGLSFQPLI